jgi:cullin 1
MRNAFESFLNREMGKITMAELLSTFTDKILSKGQKLSEKEVEEYLDKIIILFTHLVDKDLFIEIFRYQVIIFLNF